MDLKEMNDRLLSILKCPSCSDYIMPPIHMCSNGHTICDTCSSKLSSCSICMCKEWMSGRNYAMEEVAELVMYPCQYASAGCDVKLRFKDKEKHERDCLFRSFECLFTDCRLKVSRPDYLHHLKNTHIDRLRFGTNHVVRSLILNGSESEWVYSAFDHFFLVKFTTKRDKLLWKVICEGSMKEASKFYFTFSISDPKNPHNSIQFSFTPGSTESIEFPGRQFAIPTGLIYPYREVEDDDEVPMKINVHKIPEDIEPGRQVIRRSNRIRRDGHYEMNLPHFVPFS